MEVIPLSAIPSQKINVLLNNQNCSLKVHQRSTGLFIDLYVSGVPLILGVLCRDRTKLIRYGYLGFDGDLVFMDTKGADDPSYAELGDRFILVYLQANEL